jgi:hypothetical protein
VKFLSRQGRAWLGLALGTLLLGACSGARLQPRKAGDWMVSLVEIQVGAADFHLGVMGDPLDFEVSLLQNGQVVKASTGTLLSGRRGQRLLERPLTWLFSFDPRKTCQVVVEERALVARTGRWELPPTPRLGQWPFAQKDRVVRFGRESYLRFELRPVSE